MTRGERKQFLGHARGSLYEVETQLLLARRVGYNVSDDVFKRDRPYSPYRPYRRIKAKSPAPKQLRRRA
ncbi:MAG: four helix bundle protein [Acidobacteriota bacterium]|nr:four helix bundle protein [Acidobacteriota bacterium]